MTIDMKRQPPPERREAIARAGLASLKAIAGLDGGPNERAMAVMRAVRDHLLKVEVDLDALVPIAPAELAEAVPEQEWRERILRGMTVVAMLEGEPTQKELDLLDHTATLLGIDAAPVRTFRHLVEEQLNLFRVDVARRSFIRPATVAYLKNEGARGAFGLAKRLLGMEDKAVAAQYHELDDYPVGTLGRTYADFIATNRFQFPGEVGGPPPPAMRHDICHVLGGYGTTASEECGVVAFQAGFQKEDPFFVMLFTMAQFQLGISVSPFLPGAILPIDPDVIMAGLEHGTHVNRDLIGDPTWDPWDHFHEPIDELRESLEIQPRGREPRYLEYDEEGNIKVSV